MSDYKNIAIMVSGSGTNMTAVIDAVERKELAANVVLVISSNHNAGAVGKARDKGIEAVVASVGDYGSREKRDEAVLDKLTKHRVDLVVLAGYLGIITDCLLDKYNNRIINIHPSLLPKHGGAGMHGLNVHKSVLEAGDSITGATVHYVGHEIDGGDIILQRSIAVSKNDTPQELAKRVLEKVEHGLLIDAIKIVLAKNRV